MAGELIDRASSSTGRTRRVDFDTGHATLKGRRAARLGVNRISGE
jgi:hypothetical protein